MNRFIEIYAYGKRTAIATARLLILLLAALLLVSSQQGAAAQGAQATNPVLRVAPADLQIPLNGTGASEIQLEDAPDLYGVDFRLTFDPTIVEVVDADPNTPGVQIEVGALFTGPDRFVARNDVTNGVIEFAASLRAPAAPINGSGPAATITWRSKAPGQSALTIEGSKLAGANGNPVAHSAANGSIEVINGGSKISGTVLLQARSDHSNSKIYLSDKACSVSASAAGLPIPGIPDTVTDANGYFEIAVPANHTYQCLQAFQPGYLIGQCANPPTGSLGSITLPGGDVTENDIIDIFDLAYIASHYGTNDDAADINSDGVVDIFDLVVTAGNYDRRGPVGWPGCSSTPTPTLTPSSPTPTPTPTPSTPTPTPTPSSPTPTPTLTLTPTPSSPTPIPSLGCAPAPVAAVTVGDTPRGVAVDSARNRVYVANYGGHSVSVIDSNSNAVIRTIPNINSANGIAYDPANNIVWVSNYSANQVTPIQANAAAEHFTVLPPIAVGQGPWGVAYDPAHNYVYVVNNGDNSVTVIDAGTRAVIATLSGHFDQPFHIAANPLNGKVYVVNFGSGTVVVLKGTAVSKVEQLYSGQAYGVAVDETRDVIYVASVSSHRIIALGDHPEHGPDSFLGWAEFFRGFHDRHRPLPMRVIAVNPAMGDSGDGGHLWTTTSTGDGSEGDQILLIRKGWSAYFHYPTTADVGPNPGEGIAIDRAKNRVYVTAGASPGVVNVLGDSHHPCAHPAANDALNFIDFEVFINDGRNIPLD